MSDAPINLSDYVRDVADFPKPGIMFKDITPLLLNPAAFEAAIDQLAALDADEKIDVIAAAEARAENLETELAAALAAVEAVKSENSALMSERASLEDQLAAALLNAEGGAAAAADLTDFFRRH